MNSPHLLSPSGIKLPIYIQFCVEQWKNYGSRCLIFKKVILNFIYKIAKVHFMVVRNSKIARTTSIIESHFFLSTNTSNSKGKSPYVSFPKWRKDPVQPHPILNDRLKLLVTKSITHFIVTLYCAINFPFRQGKFTSSPWNPEKRKSLTALLFI